MAVTAEKMHISYDEFHNDTLSRLDDIKEFNPEAIIAIGTGGFIPGKILKERLKIPMYTVTVSLYNEDNTDRDHIDKVQWLSKELIVQLSGKKILVVDEIDDTRKTLASCTREFVFEFAPSAIGVFVTHNKLANKKDIYMDEIVYMFGRELPDVWVQYPWEA